VCQTRTTRTCYLLFRLRHVTGWRDERTWPRGVAARGAGAEKEKVSTLLSLCNKDSHNVDAGFY